ncbi:MAG TPA: FecR family protein [Puia sp.]
MQDKRIGDLVVKYLLGTLAVTDQVELQEWRDQSPENEDSFLEMTNPENLVASLTLYDEAESEKEAGRIKLLEPDLPFVEPDLSQDNKVIKLRSFPWRPLVAAASFLLVILTSAAIWYTHHSKNQGPKAIPIAAYKNDVPPGGNKAVLTLGDGSKIVLDNAQNGTLTQQGNTKVLKLDSGQLAYNVTRNNIIREKPEVLYNTITTPRGGQYQVLLPDGSKVWLNAASSLRFPTSFSGKDREVVLTGEAYFEIAKNADKPFNVKINDIRVEVLGTQFNVNAYADEELIKATLLEGSVRVAKGKEHSLLKPGQQAQLGVNANNGSGAGDQIKIIKDADTEEAIAWKNELFKFNETGIEVVMRQIARWYNVEIKYEGKLSSYSISGIVSRNNNVSNVLNILELSGFHFRIEGKKIVVLP